MIPQNDGAKIVIHTMILQKKLRMKYGVKIVKHGMLLEMSQVHLQLNRNFQLDFILLHYFIILLYLV